MEDKPALYHQCLVRVNICDRGVLRLNVTVKISPKSGQLKCHVLNRHWTLFALILRPNCFRGLLKRDLLMHRDLEVTLLMSR